MIITVKSGETPFSLANRYGVTPEQIIADNGISDETLIVGQSLIIRIPDSIFTADTDTYVSEISQKTGVTEKTIFSNNYYLGGKNFVPKGSRVILSYADKPDISLILGGYAYDFIGISKLDEVINYLSLIMPFTYGFTPDAELIIPSDIVIINKAKSVGVTPILHLSTLTADGNFDSNLPSYIFQNPSLKAKLIDNLLSEVSSKEYGGIDVDFEYLRETDKDNYVAFTKALAEKLHEIGKILIIALPPKTSNNQEGLLFEGIDYGLLGENADYVLIMAYEYGYRFGPPLAIAPVNMVKKVLDYAVSGIPANKILLGISNYGYDWTLPYIRGESDAPSISTVEALEIAKHYGAEIRFDEAAMAPFFNYTDVSGNIHEVWYEDARSFEAKVELIKNYNLAGGLIWEISRDNPQGFVTLASLLYPVFPL